MIKKSTKPSQHVADFGDEPIEKLDGIGGFITRDKDLKVFRHLIEMMDSDAQDLDSVEQIFNTIKEVYYYRSPVEEECCFCLLTNDQAKMYFTDGGFTRMRSNEHWKVDEDVVFENLMKFLMGRLLRR